MYGLTAGLLFNYMKNIPAAFWGEGNILIRRTPIMTWSGADPGYVKRGAEIQKGGRVADITPKIT